MNYRGVSARIVRGDNLRPGMCDARTVGLDVYNHPEFQIVLDMKDDLIYDIFISFLNLFFHGIPTEDKQKFRSVLYDDDEIQLRLLKNSDGKYTYRIVFPDLDKNYPETSDDYFHKIQLQDLYK